MSSNLRNDRSITVLLAGLGGQGILLLAKVLALAAQLRHDHVCRSEFRGLSQRGGSVQSVVRFGPRPLTTAIDRRSADLILALDSLEAARALPFLKPGGHLISHAGLIPPLHLSRSWGNQGIALKENIRFANHIRDTLCREAGAHLLDLARLAQDAGMPRALNTVMLGAASCHLDLPKADLAAALQAALRPEALAANLTAMEAGHQAMLSCLGDRQVAPAWPAARVASA